MCVLCKQKPKNWTPQSTADFVEKVGKAMEKDGVTPHLMKLLNEGLGMPEEPEPEDAEMAEAWERSRK